MIDSNLDLPDDWHDHLLMQVARVAYLRRAVAVQTRATYMMMNYRTFQDDLRSTLDVSRYL